MTHNNHKHTVILFGVSLWLSACSVTTETDAASSQAIEAQPAMVKTETSPAEQAEIVPGAMVKNDSGVTISTLPVPPPIMKEALEMGPVTIEALGKRLLNHNSAMWQSRSASYRLYVGGIFSADYSEESGKLVLTPEKEDATSCTYLKDGTLAPKDQNEKKKQIKKRMASCDTLLNQLEAYLVEDKLS